MTSDRPNVAIVSTVRGLDASFATWVRVHLRQGISRIYLVLDAPDEDLAFAKRLLRDPIEHDRLRLICNDAEHQRRVHALPGTEGLIRDAVRVVVARQILNVAVVMEDALRDGVDWLLHLDSDEVLAPFSDSQPLLHHLASQPEGIDEVIYANYEAVPEQEELQDPFEQVQLFKKSPYHLRYKEFEHLYTAWNGTSGRFKLFNAYITGKSALRMRDVDAPFVPYSVHHFLPMRFTDNVHIEDRDGPVVLHFPHCGLQRFVARFTGFNATRVNTYQEGAFEDDLYSQARALVDEGRTDELGDLYRRLVMLQSPGLLARLERRGYVVRRDFLADLR